MFGGNIFGSLLGLFYCTSVMDLINCQKVFVHNMLDMLELALDVLSRKNLMCSSTLQERARLEGLLIFILFTLGVGGFSAGMMVNGGQLLGYMA